jgi:hypothetical protein
MEDSHWTLGGMTGSVWSGGWVIWLRNMHERKKAPGAVMGLGEVPPHCRKGQRRCGWSRRFVLRAQLETVPGDWVPVDPTIEI